MLGSEVPDLNETPCAGCGESLVGVEDVRWDPFQRGDPRVAALPYHAACAAAAGVLPSAEPTAEQRVCNRCGEEIAPATLAAAFAKLHERFLSAKGSLISPEIVWRLASREPRNYVPEHFACVLAAVTKPRPPAEEDPPALPPTDEEAS